MEFLLTRFKRSGGHDKPPIVSVLPRHDQEKLAEEPDNSSLPACFFNPEGDLCQSPAPLFPRRVFMIHHGE